MPIFNKIETHSRKAIRGIRLRIPMVVAISLASVASIQGGDHPKKIKPAYQPGSTRVIPHTQHRAGHPSEISHHAAPSRTPAYVGYYVGRSQDHSYNHAHHQPEGTFGWDYAGVHLPRHIFGSRNRAGGGTYATDTHHVPDFVAGILSIEKRIGSHPHKSEIPQVAR